jgi:esterase/lipase superfamily enzyme
MRFGVTRGNFIMLREYHRWYSPSLGRDMELLLFGHGGAKVVVFPTSCGRFFEWENRGLIASLGHHLHQGWLQICCIDSVDPESWYAYHRHPAERVARHNQYDDYVAGEVLPFLASRNPNPFVISTGASFGGYHAINFGLRHPDLVGRIFSMSGLCDIRKFTDGYSDDNVYFNNPCDYLVHEHDPFRLRLLQQMSIILAVGRDDALCASNQRLSHVLWEKGIWHALRIWDGWAHDWPYWEKMIHLYIAGHD